MGYRNWESEWHHSIQDNDWEKLADLLKNYDFKMYKPKEPEVKKKSGKQLRLVGLAAGHGQSFWRVLLVRW